MNAHATNHADFGSLLLTSRLALAGLLAALILAATSYAINVCWLGAAHAALDVFRADDDPLRMPGLMLSSLAWGSLLAGGYRIFWRPRATRAGWIEGARYGSSVCLFFSLIQSVFLFQFITITPDLLLGDVLHSLLASTLAGALIGVIVPPRLPNRVDAR